MMNSMNGVMTPLLMILILTVMVGMTLKMIVLSNLEATTDVLILVNLILTVMESQIGMISVLDPGGQWF